MKSTKNSEKIEKSSRRKSDTKQVDSEKHEKRSHRRRKTPSPSLNAENTIESVTNERPSSSKGHKNRENTQNVKNKKKSEEQDRTHHHHHHRRREPRPASPGDGTSELEFRQKSKILEVLNAFKEDVVTVKSSQRNAWQEKLDALQQQRCSSQMSLYPSSSSIYGFQAPEDKVHEIVDKKNVENTNNERSQKSGDKRKEPEPLEQRTVTCDDLIQQICHYSSGLLSGILLWQTIFGVLLFKEMSASYWILYWSMTTILVLITVVGFLNRICMSPDDIHDFELGNFLIHLLPSLILLIFHYVNKALSLQHRECTDYLEIESDEERSRVHLSYPCQASQQNSTDVTRIILTTFPTLATLAIYTYLHLSRNQRSAAGSYRQYSESV